MMILDDVDAIAKGGLSIFFGAKGMQMTSPRPTRTTTITTPHDPLEAYICTQLKVRLM